MINIYCYLGQKTIALLAILMTSLSLAANPIQRGSATSYPPTLENIYPNHVYWGDTHLHTNLSTDAYNFGNQRLGLDEAYQFAKGQAVKTHNGLTAILNRPLDFLVIADHASNMGLMQGLEKNDADILSTAAGKFWKEQSTLIEKYRLSDPQKAYSIAKQLKQDGIVKPPVTNKRFRKSVWNEVITAADRYNQPGQFTAFIGYEWTELYVNIHRVVIYQDDSDKVEQTLPFRAWDSAKLEGLWAYMEGYEKHTGGQVLAIPHGGTRGQGTMFALEDTDGKPLSNRYALTRSRWEPLYEVVQSMGDSEAYPRLSPNDDFADYETIPPLSGENYSASIEKDLKKKSLIPKNKNFSSWLKKIEQNPGLRAQHYQYVRPALKLGLQQQALLGANPFKFGMVGGTDIHTSLSTADDNNFYGVLSSTEPNADRITGGWEGNKGWQGLNKTWWGEAWRMNAAGYTGVWAHENTREALFAAMKRKEVYASTGPRITVRFFGGWDYQENDAFKPSLAQIGYQGGVPMGGDLVNAPDQKSPTFLIRAVKDPDGANLDRVQVIKGWHDKNGNTHEKIYNVVLSDNRQANGRGQVKPVGNTVDVTNASYTNSIGAPELATVWQDPDFDSDELAFYYLRVLQIPTPRWTAYDAKRFGLKDIPDDIPMVTQERVYTSPIWYSPASKKRDSETEAAKQESEDATMIYAKMQKNGSRN